MRSRILSSPETSSKKGNEARISKVSDQYLPDEPSISTYSRKPTSASIASNFDYAHGSDGEVIRMNLQDLQKLAASFRQFSLSDAGTRKRKQLQARLVAGLDQIGYAPLRTSHIVTHEEIESLYYCLPFFSKPPTIKLLYSTHTHRRSLEELFSKTIKVRLFIDINTYL